jgi:hypothetical protein
MSGDSFDCAVGGDTGPQPVSSSAATLTVNAAVVAPTVQTHPAAQTVAAGAAFSFAAAFGGSASTYQWFRNGAQILGANALTYGGIATVQDSGAVFACRAENSAGAVTTSAALLTVSGPVATYGYTYTLGLPVDNTGSQMRANEAWMGYLVPFSAASPGGAATAVRSAISGVVGSDGRLTIVNIPFAGGFLARVFFGAGPSLAYYTIEGVAA